MAKKNKIRGDDLFGDLLTGTLGNDEIKGRSGNDTLLGHVGDDKLKSEDGNDSVYGGDGRDHLDGGDGDDVLDGGPGDDHLKGKKGDDALSGDAGDDKIDGGHGNDTLTGGGGNDKLKAGHGDDEAIYVAGDNIGVSDDYRGGKGIDTLTLMLSNDKWFDPRVQDDIARYLEFIAEHTEAETGETDGHKFQFTAFDLEVREFEQLRIFIDGIELDPADDPVTLFDEAVRIDEDDAASDFGGLSVLDNDDVPDLVRWVRLIEPPAAGQLVFQPGTEGHAAGRFSFDPAGVFDWLGEDESTQVRFVYEVEDANGDIAQSFVTITVTGSNDGLSIVSSEDQHQGGVTEDSGATLATSGVVTFRDLDLSDAHTASFELVSTNADSDLPGYPEAGVLMPIGNFGIDPAVTEDTTDQDNFGSLGWHFEVSNDDPVLQSLAEGQTLTQVYRVAFADPYGETVSQDVTVTITGKEDAPIIVESATDTIATAIENGEPFFTTTGRITFQDLDLTDGHTASFVLTSTDADVDLPGFAEGTGPGIDSLGVFEIDPSVTENLTDTVNTGTLGWRFMLDSDNPVVQSLSYLQSITQVYAVTISDGLQTVTQEVTVTILGTSDAPVAVVDAANVAAGETIDLDVLANDTDVDSDFVATIAGTAGSLTLTAVGPAAHGTVEISADGTSLVYVAGTETAATGVLIDNIKYTVSDQWGTETEGTVAVVVSTGSMAATTGSDASETIDLSAETEGQIVIGGRGDDVIVTGGGDDVIVWSAGDGNDEIEGGDGFDEFSVVLSEDAASTVEVTAENGKVYLSIDGNLIEIDGIEDLTFVGGAAGTSITLGDLSGTALAQETITFQGGAGSDYFYGRSDIHHQVIYGNGGNDTLSGGKANDEIYGGDGDDRIFGQEGNDYLDGGAGADYMSGGRGADTYIVDNVGDVVSDNFSNIFIQSGGDHVLASVSYTLVADIENLTLTGTDNINGTGNFYNNTLNGNSGDNILDGAWGDDAIYGHGGNDTLYGLGRWTNQLYGGLGDDIYYIDEGSSIVQGQPVYYPSTVDVVHEGSNEGHDTVYSQRSYTLVSNVEDLVLAEGGDFFGSGNDLNNSLTGNSGNNALDGLAGADTMTGGLGDDVYVVDNTGDVVTENAGEGTDEVRSYISYSIAGLANIEHLTLLGSANIDATGNDGSNTLTGNAGNNVLDGGLGNDLMAGGAGNDTYYVTANDAVIEHAGQGIDTVVTSLSGLHLGNNIENLTLTEAAGAASGVGNNLNNTLTGNSQDNFLYGGYGLDLLIGNAGNDYLDGGSNFDADRLEGGDGDDTYLVNSGHEIVVEYANAGYDVVTSNGHSYAMTDNVEELRLGNYAGVIYGYGNAGSNLIVGNDIYNHLEGHGGKDVILGGGGDDWIYGGAGGGQFDREFLSGGSGNDWLFGQSGYDELRGGDGNDWLYGGSEDDLLFGDNSDDVLDGGTGDDAMYGGEGNDTYYVDQKDAYSYGLGAWVRHDAVNEVGSGIDTIITSVGDYRLRNDGTYGWVEHLDITATGMRALDSTVYINGVRSTVTNYYAWKATGNQLDNVITSDENGHELIGEAGNDTLWGNGGNDILRGGDGNDLLIGGTGSNVLYGGSGNDVFVFTPGEGTNYINDMQVASNDVYGGSAAFDRIDLSAYGFTFSDNAFLRVIELGLWESQHLFTVGSGPTAYQAIDTNGVFEQGGDIIHLTNIRNPYYVAPNDQVGVEDFIF